MGWEGSCGMKTCFSFEIRLGANFGFRPPPDEVSKCLLTDRSGGTCFQFVIDPVLHGSTVPFSSFIYTYITSGRFVPKTLYRKCEKHIMFSGERSNRSRPMIPIYSICILQKEPTKQNTEITWNHWLVVWNMNFMTFHSYWEFLNLNWRTHVFQRGWNHQSDHVFTSWLSGFVWIRKPIVLMSSYVQLWLGHNTKWLCLNMWQKEQVPTKQ